MTSNTYTSTTYRQVIAISYSNLSMGYEANASMTDAELLELLETAERSICIEGQSILYKQAIVEPSSSALNQAGH